MTRLARRTFRSLEVRNYRLYFCGMLVSSTGTWMQQVAQGWLVLRLTGSGVAVGLVTAAQFLPMLLFGVWGGVIADRFEKRRTLVLSQSAMAIVAAALAAVTIADVVEIWMVFAAALLLGLATVVDNPSRQAFVSELVAPDQVANAVALNSAMFNAARIVGPAVAGLLILTAGTGLCFLINAISYLAFIAGLLLMRTDELEQNDGVGRARGQVRAGLRYAFTTPELRSTILLVAVVGMFAMNFTVVLPLLARFTFDAGPGTFGIMSSAMGVGSLVGALATASRSRPTPGLLVTAAASLGVLMVLVALSPSLAVAIPLLALTGAATITFLSTANSSLQINSTSEMRGRVMSLYALVFLGSTPIGGPVVGWVAEVINPRASMALGGLASMIGAAIAANALLRAQRRSLAEPVPVGLEGEPAAA